MRAEWVQCPAGEAGRVAAYVRGLIPAADSVAGVVREIIAGVRAGGDTALLEYERTKGSDPLSRGDLDLRVPTSALADALAHLDPDVRAGLTAARDNVRVVAEASVGSDSVVALGQGQSVTVRELPVRRAGVYAPGGRAPYPSSVVMGVVTAKAAGVEEVAVCASHPVMLAACALCGVDEVYAMTGAQAIAALAYGTETVRAVDVIVGPGNLYTQEAKRQVFGQVGIDGFAGPSDLVVIASAGASSRLIALDLLAQAEHGDDTLVVVASDDEALLDDVGVELGALLKARPSVAAAPCALVHAADLDTALQFSEALAPEHLELVGDAAEELASRVRCAGCVFIGSAGATAFGDYVAGSNHVLPTGGAARWASALSPRVFRRRMSEVRIGTAGHALAPLGAAIARAEGFPVHAESMEARGEEPVAVRENRA